MNDKKREKRKLKWERKPGRVYESSCLLQSNLCNDEEMSASQLITAVYRRRPLWDPSDVHHHNRLLVANLWKDVGQELGLNGQFFICLASIWSLIISSVACSKLSQQIKKEFLILSYFILLGKRNWCDRNSALLVGESKMFIIGLK